MIEPVYSIFFHNYYAGHEKWIRFFCEKMQAPFNLYYNIVDDSFYNINDDNDLHNRLQAAVSGQLCKLIIRKSSNQGKDIGGKLVLIDACLHLKEHGDYFVFLHDKKSPHKALGQQWQEKLFRIIEPDFTKNALDYFNQNKQTAIISGAGNIVNEYDQTLQSFASNNQPQLMQLRSKYNIDNQDYSYVAGTMFWARSQPLLKFFRENPPLEIRKTLEPGNIMDEKKGSNTHAWERLLCWLIIAQGYRIKEL